MNESWTELIVAVVSFAIGAVVTRWWDRARPLVMVQSFQSTNASQDEVECSSAIHELTMRSIHHDTQTPGKTILGNIWDIHRRAIVVSNAYQNGLARLDEQLPMLKNTDSKENFISGIRALLANPGISDALELALLREAIVVKHQPLSDEKPLVTIEEVEEHNGCFLVVWKESTTPFAKGLKHHPYLKSRLTGFVNALKHLQKDVLLDAFERLLMVMKLELDTMNSLVELTEPLIEQNSRWCATALIANYGATPMAIWPTANLFVRHKPSKARFPIRCHIALGHESKDGLDFNDIKGIHVLEPGGKVWVGVITREIQAKIPSGSLIRSHYKSGDSLGRVNFKISRRGAIFGQRVASDWVPFRGIE